LIEGICNNPAELLACRNPTGACFDEAWWKGSGFLKSTGTLFKYKIAGKGSFEFVYSLGCP